MSSNPMSVDQLIQSVKNRMDLQSGRCFKEVLHLTSDSSEVINIGFHTKDDVLIINYFPHHVPFDKEFLYSQIKSRTVGIIARHKKNTGNDITELAGAIRIDETASLITLAPILDILLQIAKELNLHDKHGKLHIFTNLDIEGIFIDSSVILHSVPYPFFVSFIKNADNKVSWNSQSNDVVYLPGKLFKFDRLLLIKKLLEHEELKSKFKFSCRPNVLKWYPEETALAQQQINNYDSSWGDLHAWIKPLTNEFDLTLSESGESGHQDWEYPMYPIETMNSSVVNLVTETWPTEYRFLTEKLYSPLITGMPFIVLNNEFAKTLSELGFITYQELVEPLEFLPSFNIESATEIMIRQVEGFIQKCHTSSDFVKKVEGIIAHNRFNAAHLMEKHLDLFNRYIAGIVCNNDLQQK